MKHLYTTENTCLSSSTCEKDLGFLVNGKLNMNQQCDMAVKKFNAILSCINRHIALEEVLELLYFALV